MASKENTKIVPCISCGKERKFRLVKKTGILRKFKEKCAACSGRGRKYKTLNYFNKIDTEEKAYAFGFFWADGCINRYKTFTVRLHLKDQEILDRFHAYFGGVLSIVNTRRADGRPYQQCSWVINDKNWINGLKSIGFRTSIDNIPKNLYRHFLRGLIDGDGTFRRGKDGKIIDVIISSNYADTFEHILPTFPFTIGRTVYKNGNKSSYFRFKGGAKIMNYLIYYLYKDNTICLSRKHYYSSLISVN